MALPPTDGAGRFLPELRTASIFSRYFAKAVDITVAGATIVVLTLVLDSYPPAALFGAGWFMLTDWAGSPGKWILRIRAVTLEGASLGPLASLKRNLVLALPTVSHALLVGGWIGLQGDDRKWDAGILLCVGFVVVLGEFIGMVMQPESRRWGDTFARSRVVDR
jgi:uncharacterized RDD family membrane protein YckC